MLRDKQTAAIRDNKASSPFQKRPSDRQRKQLPIGYEHYGVGGVAKAIVEERPKGCWKPGNENACKRGREERKEKVKNESGLAYGDMR